jgi:hypothetical protein
MPGSPAPPLFQLVHCETQLIWGELVTWIGAVITETHVDPLTPGRIWLMDGTADRFCPSPS